MIALLNRLMCWLSLVILLLLVSGGYAAQDGLDLPTELYVLLNEGRIERYGVGAAGVQSLTTGDTFILDFAISPDNNWMAYRTEEGLFLATVAGDGPATLLDSEADFPAVRGRGDSIAWSPDGHALAYSTSSGARVAFNSGLNPAFTNIVIEPLHQLSWSPGGTYLAAEAGEHVWWVFQRYGIEMNLVSVVPGANGIAWLSDEWLIFGPPEGSLRLMDLAAGNIQTVLQDETRLYSLPAIQPNGDIVAFSRDLNDSQTPEAMAYFQRMTIESGSVVEAERSEIPVELTGLRWAPKGQLMIAFRGGALSLVLPQSGQSVPLPMDTVVAFTWGAERPANALGMTATSDLYYLAPDLSGIVQIWRLPGNGIAPLTLTSAQADVTEYHLPVNPSGDLYFVSGDQVWQQPLVGSDAQPVFSLPESASGTSVSRTASTLAYSLPNGSETTGGIWFASSAPEVQPQLVLPNSGDSTTYSNPRFSPTTDQLLASLTVSESVSTVMLVDGEVIMLGNYVLPRWTDDGRVMAIGGQAPGELYLVNPETRPITPLLMMRISGVIQDYAQISVDRLRAVVSATNLLGPSPVSLVEVQIGSGVPQELAVPGFMTTPVLSPDGRYIAGLTRSGGSPMVYDVEAQSMVIISGVSGASKIRWAAFIR